MVRVAAASEAGTRKRVNEDSCCIKVAQTSQGEVVMAVVCDGVGGLAAGNLASATVVTRFSRWFEEELPGLTGGASDGALDFAAVRRAWEALLQEQNALIFAHGEKVGTRLGTTFTGIIACEGHYLVGHVGDCRAYQLSGAGFAQLTEDQTKVARMLAAGEITPEEAAVMPQNVILQAVGSGPTLVPAYYEGSSADGDLFVICCDGAWRRAGNEGIRALFAPVAGTGEDELARACQTLLANDMAAGEKDNLTVACIAMGEGVTRPAPRGGSLDYGTFGPFARDDVDEDDLPTQVEPDPHVIPSEARSVPHVIPSEASAASVVEGSPARRMSAANVEPDEDDLPTQVEPAPALADEDDLPTQVEPAPALADEDDLPTQVEPAPALDTEDDLPTMVEGADA